MSNSVYYILKDICLNKTLQPFSVYLNVLIVSSLLLITYFSVTQTLCFHLGVSADGAFALRTGVGAELIEALGAHVLFVLLHIFLPVQVVPAVVAVEAISHGGGEITPGTS